jgi:aldehyde:ferredoxin oxidoreductase
MNSATVLHIDLSSRKIEEEAVDRQLEREYIGGFGIGVKLASESISPNVDPFDPSNAIVVSAGILGGTHAPGSSRVSAITKYPLTGTISMGNGGMGFSAKLKASGYDHLVIQGKSEAPIVIKISEDQVELLDAEDLWGKDLYETTDILWERYGSRWSVIPIGQAGENRVGISLSLVDKVASIGKGGLAAIMGAKNLKAIMAGGRGPIAVSDPSRFAAAVNAVYEKVRAIPNRDKFIDWGVYWKWDNWWEEGFPAKGGNEIFSKEKATELYGRDVYLDKVKKGRTACPSCPLPDKEIMEIKEGEFAGLVTFAGGFAGRAANYGIRCGVGAYDRVVKTHDMANRMGICSHGFSSVYDLAVELFEQGVIKESDTGGIELKRDFETTKKVMEMTAHREGFGDVLADGYPGFIERFGDVVKKEALQAKGLDMLYEPRLNRLGTKTFAQVVNPRGGQHQPGVTPSDSLGKSVEDFRKYCERTGVPQDAMERIFDGPMKVNMARLLKHSQEFYTVLSCLGICSKAPIGLLYSLNDCAELYSSLKGIEISPSEMKTAGERIWNHYKLMNVKAGFRRREDAFPEKWLTPMVGEKGERPLMDYFETRRLNAEDLQNLLDDYYDECGWNKEDGTPTNAKLSELGLQSAGDS